MRNLIILSLSVSLVCSGCVFLAAGAIGGLIVAKAGSKDSKNQKRKLKLSELQRRNLEIKEVESSDREGFLRAVVTVFQDRGYMIQTSDYTGGIITAFNQEPFLQITATVESFTKTRIKMRITMSDREGIIEDAERFGKLFDDIQTEVFRRSNLK